MRSAELSPVEADEPTAFTDYPFEASLGLFELVEVFFSDFSSSPLVNLHATDTHLEDRSLECSRRSHRFD